MDTSEINSMDELKKYISNNNYLSRLYYYVTFYNDNKNGRWIHKKKAKTIRFGHKSDGELNQVDIDIYKDEGMLHCHSEGARHYTCKFDLKDHADEELILKMLYVWEAHFKN
ncbi:hypothetical protein ACTHO0_18900 [Cytobacillus praedii]|uniref:hypothetical protein n=1 Tax=Cytobacillus praedii TaxID=1742358 RepID=UPI003F81C0C4